MTYEVHNTLFDTRDAALTALVSAFLSADGMNDLEDVKTGVNDAADTAKELVDGWGGGDHGDGFELASDLVHLGPGEDPASVEELADHIRTHRADIIMACDFE